MKFLVFDDKMNRIGTKGTMEDALALLRKRNNKHGNIIQTLEDNVNYYKGYGIRNGKVRSTIKYSQNMNNGNQNNGNGKQSIRCANVYLVYRIAVSIYR